MSLLGIDGFDIDLLPTPLINHIEDHPEDATVLLKEWLYEINTPESPIGRDISRLVRAQDDELFDD